MATSRRIGCCRVRPSPKKLIPALRTSLTYVHAALHVGPEGHRNFSGRAGGSEPKVPETLRLGRPGKVHPGREPLRDVASLGRRPFVRTAGREEWTSRVLSPPRGALRRACFFNSRSASRRTARGAARRPAPSLLREGTSSLKARAERLARTMMRVYLRRLYLISSNRCARPS
jgi:hypothetical protein